MREILSCLLLMSLLLSCQTADISREELTESSVGMNDDTGIETSGDALLDAGDKAPAIDDDTYVYISEPSNYATTTTEEDSELLNAFESSSALKEDDFYTIFSPVLDVRPIESPANQTVQDSPVANVVVDDIVDEEYSFSDSANLENDESVLVFPPENPSESPVRETEVLDDNSIPPMGEMPDVPQTAQVSEIIPDDFADIMLEETTSSIPADDSEVEYLEDSSDVYAIDLVNEFVRTRVSADVDLWFYIGIFAIPIVPALLLWIKNFIRRKRRIK